MKRAAPFSIAANPAKRQQSLASFFSKPEKKRPSSDIIVIGAELDGNASKEEPPVAVQLKDSKDAAVAPYPPSDHPSYHLPPNPTFNHPFTIPSIPPSLDLRFNTDASPHLNLKLGLDQLYLKRFIHPTCSWDLSRYLLEALPWYRVNYTVRGIDIKTPRYTTVFGKDITSTSWRGYKCKPRAIPPILLRIMQKVEEVTGETYNFTLVNYYADGNDSISYHSDSESFLGPNPCIASLSLGAPRDFFLRHIKHKELSVPVEKFVLADGDMVVMRGRTQHDWQHAVPKRKSAEGRINITFRKGKVAYATENYNTYNVGKGGMYRWVGGRMVEKS